MPSFRNPFKKSVVRELHSTSTPAIDCGDFSSGYCLRLDGAGTIVDMSTALSNLLPPHVPKPASLASYLAHPVAGMEGAPAEWPKQLSLTLLSREGSLRYFEGGLLAQDGHWLLLLLDTSSQALRLQHEERRRQVLDFTTVEAIRMRQSPPEDMQSLTVEWLEGVRLRCQVSWIGIFIPGFKQWQLYAESGHPGNQPFAWQSVEFQEVLARSSESGPSEWYGSSEGYAWLVPYHEHDGPRVWLAIADRNVPQRVPFFSRSDWNKMLVVFAAPLSSGVRHLTMQQTIQRNTVLQRMLDSGWWEWDIESNRLYLAPDLARLLGLELEGDGSISLAKGLSIFEPLDREMFFSRLEQTASEGRELNEALLLTRPVQGRWLRIKGERLNSPDLRVLGYAQDISDLRQQQEATAAARARLEGLLDNAPAVIFVQSCQDGRLQFEFCSASLRRMLGWTLADLRAAPFSSLVHPEDRDRYYECSRRLLRSGYCSGRYRLRNNRGDYLWVLSESKLLRDSRGFPKEVVGLLMDVTDVTEAAERIRESEGRYRNLVEDSPAIICRYRPDMTVTFANQVMAASLGRPGAALKGLNLNQFLSPEDQEKTRKRLARLTPESPVRPVEFNPLTRSGKRVYWVWAERGLFDSEGKLIEVHAVGRDDTELYAARDQLYQSAKMATLGEMATGLAHEINQPLTVMQMAMTNIFRRMNSGQLDDEYLKGKLERVESQISRASRIVDHVRIFGRRSEAKGTPFDPSCSLKEVVMLVEEGMYKDQVKLETDIRPLPHVEGHRDRLEQVLINLLLNGQYAARSRSKTSAEPPGVWLSCRSEDGNVLITVEDNGDGIDPEISGRLFEPFYTTKPVGVGTGLGLSVSYGIISQMRGQLTADNTDRGARFSIQLPACASAELTGDETGNDSASTMP